jgi:FtsP/CotA-like multicopper oxidase with cupredoxin domain
METDRVGETAMPEDHQGVDGNPPPAQQHEVETGIEWDDTMPEMNVMSSPTNMVWKLIDTETGAVNHDVFWRFRVGDRVKIRLDNSAGSDHQMHHPFHIHGAGRFLVLDRGGVSEPNLVWKDTVLIRAGEVVNILFDVQQSRTLDGPLPHRRTHRERHDVQLRGAPARAGGDPVSNKTVAFVLYPGLTPLT